MVDVHDLKLVKLLYRVGANEFVPTFAQVISCMVLIVRFYLLR